MKLFTRLRAAYRAFLARPSGTMNPLTEPAAVDNGVNWNYTLRGLSEAAPRVEFRLPSTLPGVRPAKPLPEESAPGLGDGVVLAMDAGYKEALAQDSNPTAWGYGQSIGPGLAFLGFPFLAELQQITEYRTPAESLAAEMTRKWGKLKNAGKQDLKVKIKEITEDLETFKVRDHFREAAYKTETFGRSHIYASIKGQDDDRTRQLPLTTIEKGTLLGFSTIEPYWLTAYSWNSTHPERPDFYKPQSWYVLGRKTHHTRLMTFIFREVPDLLKPAYDFAGISITQLMMPYVNRWLRTAKNVNDLINIFSTITLATDLSTLAQKAPDDPKGLIARIKSFVMNRDNRGMMLINKGTEELTSQNVPLGSLDKLQAQAQEHMATPARMTLLKFFGITPSGLNASAEPEQESWNDYVHSMQELGFATHMKRVLDLIQMNRYGMIEKELSWEWLPLFEPTGKEKAEIRTADAQRFGVLIEKNVVSADEIRDNLRMDPDSGFDGLEGDAPEPQDWPENNVIPPKGDDDEDEDDKPPVKKDE